MGIFSNRVASASSTDRNEGPKLGRAIVLMESAKFTPSAKTFKKKGDMFKAKCKVIFGLSDVDGRMQNEDGFLGNRTGDVVDLFYMENQSFPSYFAVDLQQFGLTCLGITKADLAADGEEGTTPGEFEDEILPAILGIDAQGNEVGAGICDGTTILEVHTTFKPNSNGDTDKDGNLKGIYLSKPVRKLGADEIAEFELTDKQLAMVFGSLDQFNKLVEMDVAE